MSTESMSDNRKDDDAPVAGEQTPKPAGEPEAAPGDAVAAAAAPRRGTSPVAWLALFLALVTLAAVGYMVMEDRRARAAVDAGEATIADLGRSVQATSRSVADIDETLSEIGDDNSRLRAGLEALQDELEDRTRLLESLPARMSTLENSVAALQGVSAGARDTWLLAEAEYYMQIANAQLQLANNPHLAMLALGMADERIRQLSNPALTDVRRALADELAALEVMQKPDIEGAALTLSSLARVVESLPMPSLERRQGAGDDAVDGEPGGAARAWASVKNAFSDIVDYTPPDEEKRALLTPETGRLVRANLALQLQAARLALLRGEQAIFEQSLDDADAMLGQYFDAGSAQVESAKQTIAEVRDGMVTVSPPDISESLRLLRQYKVLSETEQ